jgi:hypothetical protein
VTISVDVPHHGRKSIAGPEWWFAKSPEKAPVIWFDGVLTLRLAPSGLLHLPVDYTGKEPPPPSHEEFPLVPGKTMPIRAQVGWAGNGHGTFIPISCAKVPANVHPVAKLKFPHADKKQSPIEVHVDLDKRCCGTLFNGSCAVPESAALGKAKVHLSFSGWREGNVVPREAEIAVSDTDTRPKVFREE